MPEDVDLVTRLAAGHVDALAELYDRHAALLLPIALRILRDRSEAEDVLHDAFVAVSERAGQYVESRGSVLAWLVTVVRNLGIDRVRRRRRHETFAQGALAHGSESTAATPERLVADAGEHRRLRSALATLPEVQRTTLEVAFFEGLSYAEIAAREKVPLGTVKSRVARALLALREALMDGASPGGAPRRPPPPC